MACVFLLINVLLSFKILFEAHKFFYNVAALAGMKIETMNLWNKFFIVAFAVVIIAMIAYFENRYRNRAKEGMKRLLDCFFIFAGLQLLLITFFQTPFFLTLGYRLGWSECARYFVKPALGILLVLFSLRLRSEHDH
ncbi:MAG: Uncharacterized protein XD58_0998 [Thermotoga sp. 50_1627]|nr:MAG: Uncharacterized protein XD45_1070 [Thermotoga sp. 50_64]KUK24967.1 MAG: Uncharacterized protein XD58_0998 [Thermotoga sp. 50_1627]HBT39170.1 hypothetical protein [Pseudothermotoga sp.]HCO97497.1 hypothetical protein [Pseudothermotoga sp.]